jgi:hypothetical protein
MVKGMSRGAADDHLRVIRPRQQAANPACALQAAAQIIAPRVSHPGQVVDVPFLNHHVAVI